MAEMMPNGFAGLRVITSVYLVEDGVPVELRRSWRERLLTLPWRPFVKTRVFVPKVPYRGAMQISASTIVMHPATVASMKSSGVFDA